MNAIKGPDFICIGAQKAGTTWLYDNLVKHPEICMPPFKELHFFNRLCPNEQLLGVEASHTARGMSRLHPLLRRPSVATARWLYRFFAEERTTEAYYRLFDFVPDGKISGDMTPAYSTLDARGVGYARKILKPECKAFLVIRDPIERIWSGIKMAYRWADKDLQTVDIDEILRTVDIPVNMLRTNYPSMLTLWSSAFGENFRVFLFDDLNEDPHGFVTNVLAFLGLSPYIDEALLARRSNADPRRLTMPDGLHSALLERFEGMIHEIEEHVPGIGARWLRPGLK